MPRCPILEHHCAAGEACHCSHRTTVMEAWSKVATECADWISHTAIRLRPHSKPALRARSITEADVKHAYTEDLPAGNYHATRIEAFGELAQLFREELSANRNYSSSTQRTNQTKKENHS